MKNSPKTFDEISKFVDLIVNDLLIFKSLSAKIQTMVPNDWNYVIKISTINGVVSGYAAKFNGRTSSSHFTISNSHFTISKGSVLVYDRSFKLIGRFKNIDNAAKKIFDILERKLENLIEIIEK